jgi:hypothetical protein
LKRLLITKTSKKDGKKTVETFEVSADQNHIRDGEIVNEFYFPSAMQVREAIKRKFEKFGTPVPTFTSAEYPSLIKWIRSLDPLPLHH